MDPSKRRWEDQHWFWRGFQSAVFLYAQCGPCIAWRENHRQKKQWKLEKEERAKYADQPGITRQPAPHEVNPHWQEEIRLGPAPPPKKRKKRADTRSSRDTASSGTLVASETDGMDGVNGKDKEKPMFWNAKRFQRPDEEYTYVDVLEEREQMVYAPPGLMRKGSSVGVPAWTVHGPKLPEKPRRMYVPTATMPPVNELHPPVVSSVPAKKEDRAWMTAPPPSAAFMHGKKGTTTRARSGSGNSSLRKEDAQLSKQIGQKAVEDKLKHGERPAKDVEIRPSARHMAEDQAVAAVERQRSKSESPFRLVREKTPPSPMRPRSKRPTALRLDSDKSSRTATSSRRDSPTESEATSSSDHSSTRRDHSKPTYQSITKTRKNSKSAFLNSHPISPPPAERVASISSTMLSEPATTMPPKDSAAVTPLSDEPPPLDMIDTYTPSPRKRKDTKVQGDDPPLLVKDSSLHILQDVVDPSSLLNSRFVKSPVLEARIPLPSGSSPLKEDEGPLKRRDASAKEQLLLDEGQRRWSWGV